MSRSSSTAGTSSCRTWNRSSDEPGALRIDTREAVSRIVELSLALQAVALVGALLWSAGAHPRSRVLVAAGLAAFALSQGLDVLEEMLEMLGPLALWIPMLHLVADRLGTLSVETVS